MRVSRLHDYGCGAVTLAHVGTVEYFLDSCTDVWPSHAPLFISHFIFHFPLFSPVFPVILLLSFAVVIFEFIFVCACSTIWDSQPLRQLDAVAAALQQLPTPKAPMWDAWDPENATGTDAEAAAAAGDGSRRRWGYGSSMKAAAQKQQQRALKELRQVGGRSRLMTMFAADDDKKMML